MKFSATTLATFATVAALSSSTNAFSVGPKASPRFDPFQLRTQTGNPKHARSPLGPLLATPEASAADAVDDEVHRLKAMAAKLRQEAAELEAQQATERASAIEKAFDRFDTDKDGELSVDELKAALEKTFKLELEEERVQRLMDDFDTSGDGALQKDEFVGIEQFRNRLEALASEERRKALEATKAAQQEAETAKLMESTMELINDKQPTNVDRAVSVLPYLFPLMDGLLFGQYLLAGNESNPVVATLAIIYTLYRSVPFSGFLAFFALSAFSGNLSINRLVRFNMQQAIFLDVALFVPGLIAALTSGATQALGLNIPPMVGELSSDALFVGLVAILGYSAVSSLLGVTPDKVPFVSQAVNDRLPSADMIEFIDPTTGEPIFKKTEQDNKDDEKKD
ncbi:Inherit from NOG: protein transport [Seminavis robusta]|uniref:Inherit from NOG: protein transport n=1 Tax=Seminavis robusta TaxID=568900 RepID=A0A9N8DY80_9STRA|nr:Inherit from NOG: protein transport [Seminavis robusta]|eukprot:Sro336_g120350.1 Inherit from NOG: protein transport (396) ;mRNA; f:38505-39692